GLALRAGGDLLGGGLNLRGAARNRQSDLPDLGQHGAEVVEHDVDRLCRQTQYVLALFGTARQVAFGDGGGGFEEGGEVVLQSLFGLAPLGDVAAQQADVLRDAVGRRDRRDAGHNPAPGVVRVFIRRGLPG